MGIRMGNKEWELGGQMVRVVLFGAKQGTPSTWNALVLSIVCKFCWEAIDSTTNKKSFWQMNKSLGWETLQGPPILILMFCESEAQSEGLAGLLEARDVS